MREADRGGLDQPSDSPWDADEGVSRFLDEPSERPYRLDHLLDGGFGRHADRGAFVQVGDGREFATQAGEHGIAMRANDPNGDVIR